MQMNMSTGYKPEVQTTIPSTSICEEERGEGGGVGEIIDAPTPNYQSACAQSILWAGST